MTERVRGYYTDIELGNIRARHEPDGRDRCAACWAPFPCATRRLIASVVHRETAASDEIERLRAQVAAMCRVVDAAKALALSDWEGEELESALRNLRKTVRALDGEDTR